jgi:hypothetical protein
VNFTTSRALMPGSVIASRHFRNRAWGMPLYFYAQMILASQAGG